MDYFNDLFGNQGICQANLSAVSQETTIPNGLLVLPTGGKTIKSNILGELKLTMVSSRLSQPPVLRQVDACSSPYSS
ncbi:MAG: hypothetical protein ACK59A_16760 [Cyanobacteriota bacterium]